MVEAAAILQGQLIAAESELQGLSQIYTDSNVRVRSGRARIAELQKQLEKMGGDDASLTSDQKSLPGDSAPEIYPSIRKLPLLGVQWADLYRETKIEETVYSLLTGQYELAKIQEAKEVPSVQVFDIGEVPEKSSGPPRLLIMTMGATFFLAMGVVWILGRSVWHAVSSDDPRKQFVQHVGRETLLPLLRMRSGPEIKLRIVSPTRQSMATPPTPPCQRKRRERASNFVGDSAVFLRHFKGDAFIVLQNFAPVSP